MATREETIRYVYQVTGNDDLTEAARSILGVGEATEETQAAVRKLADEFAKTSDASEAAEQYAKAAKSQEELAEAAEKAALKLRLASQQHAGNAAALEEANEAVRRAKKAEADYAAQTSKTAKVQQVLRQAVRESTAEQKDANKAWKQSNKALRTAESGYKLADRAQENLNDTLRKFQQRVEDAEESTEDLAGAQKSLAQRSAAAKSGMADLAEAARRQERRAEAAAKATEKLGNAVSGLRSALKLTAVASGLAAVFAAVKGVRLFTGAIDEAAQFEQKITEVGALVDATAEQFARLEKAAEDAGAAYGFTASESADALGELARASGDAETAIAQLPATLALARAGQLDLATAAQFVVQTMNQFGFAAGRASEVSDVLAKTANATATNVQGVGNAMSYAGPLARQLGLSLQETAAAIGALAQNGFQGERAGTALRAVFQSLLDPTSQFSQELKRLNIDTSSFNTIIQGLTNAGQDGVDAILKLNATAVPAILSLVSNGGGALQQLTADLNDSAGAAERTAGRFSDTFETAKARIAAAFQFLRVSVVEQALDPIKDGMVAGAKGIREFIESADFTELSEAIGDFAKKGVAAITRFVKSIDFADATKRITAFLSTSGDRMSGWVKSLESGAKSVKSIVSAVGSAIDGLQTAIFGIATALSFVVESVVSVFSQMAAASQAMQGNFAGAIRTMQKMEPVVGGLHAVTVEFARRTTQNFNELTGTIKDTTEAAGNMGAGVAQANEKVAASQDQVTEAGKRTLPVIDKLVAGFEEQAEAAEHAGEQTASFADKLVDSYRRGEKSAFDLRQALSDAVSANQISAEQAGQALERVGQSAATSADKTDQLAGSFRDAGAAADDMGASAGQAGDQAAESVGRAAAIAASLSEQMKSARGEFLAVSDAAATMFDELTKSFFEAGRGIFDSVESMADTTRIRNYQAALKLATETVRAEVAEQRTELAGLVDSLTAVGVEGNTSFHGVSRSAGRTAEVLDKLAVAVEQGSTQFTLLGEQELRPLQAALDSARQRTEALQDAAKAAADQLADMARSSQDAIDRAEGDEAAIENRRFAEQLARIEELAAKGGAQAREQAERARELASREHRIKLQEIEERALAQQQAAQQTADKVADIDDARRRRERQQDQADQTSSGAGGGGVTRSEQTVVIKIDGQAMRGFDPNNPRQMEALARSLLPAIMRQLQAAARRSGVAR